MANDDLKNLVGNLVDKSKNAAKKAGEYASSFLDSAKTKVDSEKIEYAISKRYRDLGKAYYNSLTTGESFDPSEIKGEIDELFDQLVDIQKNGSGLNPVVDNIADEPDDIDKYINGQ
ncbi:MAG: hypothetical protein K5629_07370 [Eubacteriales bacterium]|nr:hypothetical protein [Eubacteriales bacterium]